MDRKSTMVNGVAIPPAPPVNCICSTMEYWRQHYPVFYSRYKFNSDVLAAAQRMDLDRCKEAE